MKNRIRLVFTILIILLLAAIILYPKIKPLFDSKGKGVTAGSGQMMRPGGGQQILNVSGFLISPDTLNQMIKSTGTLLPDEEVDPFARLVADLDLYDYLFIAGHEKFFDVQQAYGLPESINRKLLYLGFVISDSCSVKRAYDVGFVNKVVPLGEERKEARRMARIIADWYEMDSAGLPPSAMRTKRPSRKPDSTRVTAPSPAIS